MNIDLEQLKEVLSVHAEPREQPCPPLPGMPGKTARPAAVLMPLISDQGIWKLLFIKRTVQENDSHSGQIAFPGGGVEKGDRTFQSTALRESQEELGIDPSDVEIIGKTCPINTVTGYEIHPFLGVLSWPYALTLSRDEVLKTILIPLSWLADPKNRQTRPWQSRSNPGRQYPVIFFTEYEGEILWGATAQIVSDFLNLIQAAG